MRFFWIFAVLVSQITMYVPEDRKPVQNCTFYDQPCPAPKPPDRNPVLGD